MPTSPGVNLYRRPADAVFMIGFIASVLAAFSLDRLLAEHATIPVSRILAVFGVVAAAFAVMAALALRFDKLGAAWPHIAIPAALFAAAGGLLVVAHRAERATRSLVLAAMALFTVLDLAYSNGPGGATALPPETFEVLEPKSRNDTIALLKSKVEEGKSETRRDRVELVGFGFHWPNASLTHGLENTLGYNPVRLAHYNRALGAGDHVGLPEQKGFSPLLPSYRSRLADLLGLRYIATSVPVETIDKNLKPGDLTLVAKTSDGYVYENPRALDRVLFATHAIAADFNALLETGAWPDVDFNTTVLLEAPDGAAARQPGRARITAYHNTRVDIAVDSPEGGYAVLNDIWHPWWFAAIDGKSAPDPARQRALSRRRRSAGPACYQLRVPPGARRTEPNWSPEGTMSACKPPLKPHVAAGSTVRGRSLRHVHAPNDLAADLQARAPDAGARKGAGHRAGVRRRRHRRHPARRTNPLRPRRRCAIQRRRRVSHHRAVGGARTLRHRRQRARRRLFRPPRPPPPPRRHGGRLSSAR